MPRNAPAGVPHPKCDLPALAGSGHRNPPSLVGVLRGVVDKVRQDLGDPRKVAHHQQRLRRQHDSELMFKGVDDDVARVVGAAVETSRSTIGPSLSSILPRVMRETSSRSSTRRTSWRSWRPITSLAQVSLAGSCASGWHTPSSPVPATASKRYPS